MADKILGKLDKAIWVTYLALTVITPLLFSTRNSELFEVPKMIFVYFAAVIILALTKIKFVVSKKKSFPANLIFLSFAFLLIINILSTLTSIDKFTSIYGFPSRLNGGVISLFAYLIIFAGALINLDREKIITLLNASVITALAVSLWGIPGHFGYDPNCYILTGHLTSTCWQKEFNPTERIFSTMGQPNWLASYLVLIIPIAIAQIFISKRQNVRNFFIISTIIILIALIFTNSRAGVAGFIVSLLIFALTLGKQNLKKFGRIIIPLFIFLILIGVIFGTSLLTRTKEALGKSSSPGTESGAIRLIVWRGALDVFRKHPILGTGPETFAYSYYQVRPREHNATTEWNFFYNKAHNEFLNYLANTGILGFTSYIFFLATTLFFLWKIGRQKDEDVSTLTKAIFASLIGYQITIFFGFSTVATQLLMFLLISSSLVLGKKESLKYINLKFLDKLPQSIAISTIVVVGLIGILYAARIYAADIFIAKARDSGNQKYFDTAIKLFPTTNPFYLADSAYATIVSRKETTLVLTQAQNAIDASSNNLLVMRRVANTYLLIAESNDKYKNLALDTGQKLITLAPTDPQTYLAFAKIQVGLDKNEEAKQTLKTALQLKPDYTEARDLLDQIENSTYNTNNDANDKPSTN